jgi:ribosomal protein S18 acetylase RimI-like enzyme
VKFTLIEQSSRRFGCTYSLPTRDGGSAYQLSLEWGRRKADHAIASVRRSDRPDQKLSHILQCMYSDSAAKLYVWIEDDGAASGQIGWRVQGGALEILHIAVDEETRHQGIGRRLIDATVALERPHEALAETDHDAVEVYQHYGFCIQSLGEKYPGVERFCSQERDRRRGPRFGRRNPSSPSLIK